MYDGLGEKLLVKSDVLLMFRVTKLEWAKAASGLAAPGWSIRYAAHDTGAEVIGVSPYTGAGLSIRPFFVNETTTPESIVIVNVLPPGTSTPMTASGRKEMESLAQQELGPAYSVTLKHKINANLQMVIEFWITKALRKAAQIAQC
ncbi:MAG: hypothetical protein ACXW6V_14980 [Candidatus Binatia bacterium]